jgi:hypothetical protein
MTQNVDGSRLQSRVSVEKKKRKEKKKPDFSFPVLNLVENIRSNDDET